MFHPSTSPVSNGHDFTRRRSFGSAGVVAALAGAVWISALSACSTGSTGSGGQAASGEGGAPAAPGAAPVVGRDPSLMDCDKQAESVSKTICGSVYEELWSCPAAHAKPANCTLSTERDSFCCPLAAPPVCTDYCTKLAGCTAAGSPATCPTDCAMDLKFIEELDGTMCRSGAEDYLSCVSRATGAECRDGAPFAAACEKVGETSISCQTEGNYARSPENDSKCAAKSLPSRGYLANGYGYAPHCFSFDADKTLTPGELMCCSYP